MSDDKLVDVVAIGEPLIQFNALTLEPLRYVNYFENILQAQNSTFALQ